MSIKVATATSSSSNQSITYLQVFFGNDCSVFHRKILYFGSFFLQSDFKALLFQLCCRKLLIILSALTAWSIIFLVSQPDIKTASSDQCQLNRLQSLTRLTAKTRIARKILPMEIVLKEILRGGEILSSLWKCLHSKNGRNAS